MDETPIRNRYAPPLWQPVTTGRKRANEPDYDAKKWFVYTLSDADGVPLYVGRSNNVAGRIRGHYSDATHGGRPEDAAFKAGWLRDARSVSMAGPFTWDEAVAEERRQIKTKLPRGNRTGMPKKISVPQP